MKRNPQGKKRAYHEKSELVQHIHGRAIANPLLPQHGDHALPKIHGHRPILNSTQAYRALDAFQEAFPAHLASAERRSGHLIQ
ncbi:hypothetical protein O0I10_013277, partial [Lichtheimia ornata]